MATTERGSVKQAGRDVARTAIRTVGYVTSAWRGLPDFLLIGTKRGGTTSLYRQLEMHPAYVPLFPSANRLPMRENLKGVHYFDTNHHRGEAWYRSHFQTDRARRAHHERAGIAFTGDASPYYLFHPLAAQRAAALVPDAKLIVLLRDPVERTISHWSEQTRDGVETLPLGDALAIEAERMGDSTEQLLAGRIRRSFAHEHQSYGSQSEYAVSLSRWLENFQREQLLVLFSEDYYNNPRETLGRVTGFLGLSLHADLDLSVRNASTRSEVDADIRAALITRFEPDAAAVADLVGQSPPWTWLRGAGSKAPST